MSIKRRKIIKFYGFIGMSFFSVLLATSCAVVKKIVVQPYGSQILIPKETFVGEIEPVIIKEKKDGRKSPEKQGISQKNKVAIPTQKGIEFLLLNKIDKILVIFIFSNDSTPFC